MNALNKTLLLVLPVTVFMGLPMDYPVDGFQESGIRRVERLRLRIAGDMQGGFIPPAGALKSIKDIQLHLHNSAAETVETFPEQDPELQRQLEQLFAERDESYSVAILDITDPDSLRFASLRENIQYQPGSVGKICIGIALFRELQRLYPEAIGQRLMLLQNRRVIADDWIHKDTHGVPLFDPETRKVGFRPIETGDEFTLYEWADHMLSASSNAAASTVWKEVILMRHFGHSYPPSKEDEAAFFKNTPKQELSRLAMALVNDPLREVGIGERHWKLGSFFTRVGKQRIPGIGSLGTPHGLLLFLVRIEQGRVVDSWSSLELKRLLYMTEKRIRYASAPRLSESAVYFKSGSLYSCRNQPGTNCGKYQGTTFNYMNSIAIVEKPDGRTYLVALMSNVLKINSAVEHQTLATYIDRILIQTAPK